MGVALTLAAEARAQAPLELLVAPLEGNERDWQAWIEAVSRQPDPRALELLKALDAGELQARADGALVIKRVESLLDPLMRGVPVPAGATIAPILNNRLRRTLAAGLARAGLFSADSAERAASALSLGRDPDAAMRPVLVEVLGREQDANVRAPLRFALARLDLHDPLPERQLDAVRTLGEQGELSLIDELKDFAGQTLTPAVRAEAKRVLARLETRALLLSGLANLFYGLSLGSVLLLASLGLAVTFGLMRVINMAHGEMLMLGAYATYVVQGLFTRHWSAAFDYYLLAALPAAFAVTAATGMLLERLVLRHLYGRPLETLLATWGISLGIIQTVRLTFGAQNVAVQNPAWLSGGWMLMPTVVLPYSRIATIAFGAGVVWLLSLLMRRSRLGLYVRAVTQNREMAGASGIATRAIDTWTFGLGSGIAGLGGVALSQLGNVGPELGQSYIVDSFMVVVLGGVGSIAGTVAGALGLGVVSKILEPTLGAVLGKIFLLVVLIGFIQVRPQGIFAAKGRAAEL